MKILSNHDFTNFQDNVKSFTYIQESSQKNNKPIIFILCAPRTGSTLLRIMLASNRKLFSPQELFLLPYSNVSERNSEFSGCYQAWNNGLINTLMNIFKISAQKAAEYLDKESKAETDIQTFYNKLQNAIENRVLVDKSTTNALSINYLKNIPQLFSNVKYIHLIRHPYGMINSFDKSVIDLIEEYKLMLKDSTVKYTKIEFAELLWTICNINIGNFLSSIDNENIYIMRYEDLVHNPEIELKRLCNFLNLEFDRNMLNPYEQSEIKIMTTGISSNTAMTGAREYYKYKKIEPENINKWMENYKNDFLSKVTFKVAKTFSYKSIEELEAKKLKIEIVNLPLDDRRLEINEQKMGEIIVPIECDYVKRMEDIKARRFIRVDDAYLPALLILLRRYSGQDEIVIGRVTKTLEVMPIKCNIDVETKVSDVISQIRKSARLSGEAGFSNLKYQVLFIENDNENNINLLISENHSVLAFVVSEQKKNEINIKYNSFRFKRETIERMSKHFNNILVEMITKSGQPVLQIDILDREEKQKLLVEWNDTSRGYPDDRCVHQLLEQQVEQSPDAVAVVCKDQQLTYRELNARANQLAHYLKGLGVGPEVLVGICIERSIEMIVGLLGILKAGGAYVPLDPAYPKERLTFILQDTAVPVLLTQQHLLEVLPECGLKVICLDANWRIIAKKKTDNLISEALAENAAYVIYTSGSTGKPKGVIVTHGNVVRLMKATEPWYGFDPEDVWTLFHSYAFDFSVWEIWGALLYGARLVIVPYEVSRSPKDFYNLIINERVTVLNQTPSAFHQLIQAEETFFPNNDLALRLIIFGGEALELQSLKPWFKRYGDQNPQLVNMYGITETTVHVTYRPITNEDVQSGQGSVIGGRIPDLQLYVLDGNLQPVPIGVTGELFVGGAGLARGYLNRPELTVERFIPNPYNSIPGGRLYKTGDVARYHPNGDLEYLGRVDQQVQIRGFRVELGEIEAALAGHPGVNLAVVMAREDRPGDKRLVAYVVAHHELPLSFSELRSFLKEKLPDYMIPSAFEFLDALPLTPNGKVDRRALPTPDWDRSRLEMKFTPPCSPVEKRLAKIWCEVLGLERVGVHDNFFELGGHSLLATSVVSWIRQEFHVDLNLVEIFKMPTIADLTKGLEGLLWINAGRPSDDEAEIQNKEEGVV